MPEVNLIAVLVAGVSSMVLGAIWYSPLLFGPKWQAAAGLTDGQVASGNPAMIYGGAFVLSLLAAYVFAMFLGPKPGLNLALGAGFGAGFCWVAASFGISYLFERRSLGHWAINGFYHTFQFGLFGLVFGLMS